VIVATDGQGVNMRTAPSSRAQIITTVREGTPVEVIGDPVNAEGRAWRQIRVNDRDGWVVAVTVRQR
jgi:SH3-like domain-containing protein